MDNQIKAADVLEWLYDMQYTFKTNRGRAERKPNVQQSELDAIDRKLRFVDYLIGRTIEEL